MDIKRYTNTVPLRVPEWQFGGFYAAIPIMPGDLTRYRKMEYSRYNEKTPINKGKSKE